MLVLLPTAGMARGVRSSSGGSSSCRQQGTRTLCIAAIAVQAGRLCVTAVPDVLQVCHTGTCTSGSVGVASTSVCIWGMCMSLLVLCL